MANFEPIFKGDLISEPAYACPYAGIDDNYSSDPNSICIRKNDYLNNHPDDNTFINSIRQAREAEAYRLFKDYLDGDIKNKN